MGPLLGTKQQEEGEGLGGAWFMGSTRHVDRGGRLQLLFFCSAMDKTEGLGLGGQKERRRQPAWFSGRCSLWFSRGCLLRTGICD